MKLRPLTKLLVGGACLFTGASLGAALGAGTYAIIANGIASVTAGNVANAIDALTNGSIEDISLENQDLVKAIGRAIGKIIADVANNKLYQKYKSNLLKIAKNAEENWLIIAEESDLSSNDVPSYIQQNFHDIQESPLDLEEWKDIFIRLNLKTFPNGGAAFPPELITDIAKILQQVFPHALTEVLKSDFVHDGKAYAGLTLRLLTDIKASLDFSQNEKILAKLEELIVGLQQNPEEVFREISEQIEVGFTTVIGKLDTVEEKIDYIIEKFDNSQVSGDNLRGINGKKITEAQWTKACGISRTEFNNRRSLLAKVNQEVKDRLSQSLHHKVLIDLGKEKQPQQVERIWDVEVKVGNNPTVKLPRETSILDIFDDESIAGKLLILGAPGGGKTTTLLQLAEGLIERAEYDVICPIPVILELSSWKPIKTGLPWDRKEKDLTIAEWIERELLSGKYADLPLDSKVIRKWIKEGAILPLFDGLDELPADRQAKCIQAINLFKCLQMVVCSRKEAYELYETKLILNNCIVLQQLDETQIEEYFKNINKLNLWQNIKRDSELLELAKTPLFLYMIALTNLDKISKEKIIEHYLSLIDKNEKKLLLLFIDVLLAIFSKYTSFFNNIESNPQRQIELKNSLNNDDLYYFLINNPNCKKNDVLYHFLIEKSEYGNEHIKEAKLKFLFDKYIERRLISSKKDGTYEFQTPMKKTTYEKTLRYLHYIAKFLSIRNATYFLYEDLYSRYFYPKIVVGTMIMVFSLLVQILIVYFISYFLLKSEVTATIMVLISSIFRYLWLEEFVHIEDIRVTGNIKFSLVNLFSGFKKGFSIGGLTAIYVVAALLKSIFLLPIVIALIIGLITETNMLKNLQNLNWYILYGYLILSLIAVLLVAYFRYDSFTFGYAVGELIFLIQALLIGGTIIGSLSAIANSLIDRVKISQSQTEVKYNTNFKQILTNSTILGGLFSISFGLSAQYFYHSSLGFLLGLFIWLILGGFKLIDYLSSYLILTMFGVLAWNMLSFLDYYAERMMLQRVGKSYRFIHRLLQEHFANMEIEQK